MSAGSEATRGVRVTVGIMLGSAEAWVGVVEELAVAVEVGVAGRVGGCLGDGDRAGYFNLARSDPRARLGA